MASDDQWVSVPNSPWRIVETVGQSLLALGAWVLVLNGMAAVAGPSVEWLAASE